MSISFISMVSWIMRIDVLVSLAKLCPSASGMYALFV